MYLAGAVQRAKATREKELCLIIPFHRAHTYKMFISQMINLIEKSLVFSSISIEIAQIQCVQFT